MTKVPGGAAGTGAPLALQMRGTGARSRRFTEEQETKIRFRMVERRRPTAEPACALEWPRIMLGPNRDVLAIISLEPAYGQVARPTQSRSSRCRSGYLLASVSGPSRYSYGFYGAGRKKTGKPPGASDQSRTRRYSRKISLGRT